MASAATFSFFFNDTATTEIYTLSLHDALPISVRNPAHGPARILCREERAPYGHHRTSVATQLRSEEHTSELQSRQYLVCRLLLEKKNLVNYASQPYSFKSFECCTLKTRRPRGR